MMRYRRVGPANASGRRTMDRHQLADLIRRHGIWFVVEAFEFGAASRVVVGIRDGINLHGWEAWAPLPGVVLFGGWDNDAHAGEPVEGVAYVNTDDPERIRLHTRHIPWPCVVFGRTEARRDEIDPEREAHWRTVAAPILRQRGWDAPADD